jgi:signal transduction histidine kinase
MKLWRDLSVAKKLYAAVGIMSVLIGCELLTLRFAMKTLSAVRAFVSGEALWSKAQKDAVFNLQRYSSSHQEKDYQEFLFHFRLPEGDHQARVELSQPHPDLAKVRAGFLVGGIHGDDIDPMVDLIRRFGTVNYIGRAIKQWTDGDRLMTELKAAGERLHDDVTQGRAEDAAAEMTLISDLNRRLTAVEADFSNLLGQGSRWIEHVVLLLLCIGVALVESVGITLTILTARAISRSLGEIRDAANRIRQGDFSQKLDVRSGDELGIVAQSINSMSEVLERKVSERTRALSLGVEARDEFLSVAAHELKTPLTALRLQIQLVERMAADRQALAHEKNVKTIQRASQQVLRMQRLVDQLLDLARLQHGRIELHAERCDLAAIVTETVEEQETEAARAGSSVKVLAANSVQGSFDPVRLRQVVSNLMSNAIKYGNGQPIDVLVDQVESTARILVRDHGRGISEELKDKVFDRFERAEEVREITGLGLGLYVTRHLVEAHGGKISVESRLGQGSTFRVDLPLERA